VVLPTLALLNGIGVAFLRRLDLAGAEPAAGPHTPILTGTRRRQLPWPLVAVPGDVDLLADGPDQRLMSRFSRNLGLVGLILMALPGLLPASISERHGAKLWITIGPFSVQPGEFAKLALLGFFAYYLVRKREVLSLASRRFLGIDLPRGRDLGPVV